MVVEPVAAAELEAAAETVAETARAADLAAAIRAVGVRMEAAGRALVKTVMASLPDPPRVTPGQATLNPNDFIRAAEQAFNTTETFPNNSAYRTAIKIKDIQVPYSAGDIDPSHAANRVKLISPLYPRLGQVEPYSVSYQLQSVGEGIAGLNGSVTLVEEGVLNFKLLVRAEGGGLRVGSFAEFALFLDHFDPYNPEGPFIYQGLVPGDRFAGRVHTN